MTTEEIRNMIAKSERRLDDLREKGIDTVAMKNYHAGYQDALRIVLSSLILEEDFAREPTREREYEDLKKRFEQY